MILNLKENGAFDGAEKTPYQSALRSRFYTAVRIISLENATL